MKISKKKKQPRVLQRRDIDFSSHKGTTICTLTEELHYMILGGTPIPVSTQTKSVTGRTSCQGKEHTSAIAGQMFNTKGENRDPLCATMRACMSFPMMLVRGRAGWETESQKLHTDNGSPQTGKWGRESLSPSGLVSVNLRCEGSATLTGKCWHPCWSSALKSEPDNYEAAVSPAFLGMLLTTPLHAVF